MIKPDSGYLMNKRLKFNEDATASPSFSVAINQTSNNQYSSLTAYSSPSSYTSAYNSAYFSLQNPLIDQSHLNTTKDRSVFYQQNRFIMCPSSNEYNFHSNVHPMRESIRTSIGSVSPDSNSSQSLISPILSEENEASLSTGKISTSQLTNSSLNLKACNSSNSTTGETQRSLDDSLPIKKRRPISVELKDSHYWEKRRKNNESAKRSRENRKTKEEHISIRVIYLEQENLQLRTECSLLRNEIEKLRSIIYQSHQNIV